MPIARVIYIEPDIYQVPTAVIVMPADQPDPALRVGVPDRARRVAGPAGALAGPEAELWLGAHPTAPSLVPGPDGPVPLSTRSRADPQATLGDGVLSRFGNRLPYL